MPRAVQDKDSWAERIAKLLPAEATAAFIAINSFITSSSASLDVRIWVWGASILVLCASVPFLLARIYSVGDDRQIAVSTGSFPLWAISINPDYVAEILSVLGVTVEPVDIQLYVSIVTVLVATIGPAFLARPRVSSAEDFTA